MPARGAGRGILCRGFSYREQSATFCQSTATLFPFFLREPGWQRGWFAQHQRLIEAISSQKKRASVVVEGDFHATAAGKIHRSGELTMAQPVHVVLGGSLGSGDLAFPSSFRNIESTPSQLIGMDQALKPTEKNGFTVVEVTPEKLKFKLFMWRPPRPIEEIDIMEPVLV